MPGRHEIRQVLRNASEPMHGREICDALGCEDRKDRDLVYKSLSIMATGRLGVEQLDDRRFSLIPGWKDNRSEATAQRNKERAKAEPAPTAATVGADVQADRVVVDGASIGAAAAIAMADNVIAPGPIKPLVVRNAAWPYQTVMLPRHTVRTLVAAVLTRCGDLNEELRQAVIDATREAA